MIKAVLFDMDGVLVDSHDAWFNVINGCRDNFDLKKITIDEFDKDIWARPLDSFVDKYFPDIEINKLNNTRECMIDDVFTSLKMNNNVDKVLQELKNKEIKIAVVSNNGIDAIDTILDKFKIKSYFDEIIHVGMIDKPKPDPDSILKALELMKLNKEEVLFVGDTIFDRLAAKNAGVRFVGFNIKGDHSIKDMKELLEIIKDDS